jgi:precorrin-3B synthase
MLTGDGYLARLPPLIRSLGAGQLGGIAALAAAHGNGLVEISSRGNFQIRGIREGGGPALAEALGRLGLDLQAGIPVSIDPLAGFGTLAIDPRAFVAALQERVETRGLAPRLAPKLAIVLDYGTAFRPAHLSADLRLRFGADRADIGLGGDDRSATWIGSVETKDVVEAAAAILACLAGFGRETRLAGTHGIQESERFQSVVAAAISSFQPDLADIAVFEPSGDSEIVAAIAFPFGQASADDLARLAEAAGEAGITAITPASDRTLLLQGSPAAVIAMRRAAAEIGFISEPQDPRRAVFACIGSAGCASGLLPTRALAAELANAAPSLLDGSFALHVSGCAKGCAHADAAPITLAAIDKRLAIVLEGRARDDARGFVPAKHMAGRIRKLGAEIDRLRQPGEPSAAVLARIGTERIAAILVDEGSDGPTEDGNGIDGGEPIQRDRERRLSA